MCDVIMLVPVVEDSWLDPRSGHSRISEEAFKDTTVVNQKKTYTYNTMTKIKKDKRKTNDDVQDITQTCKYRATRTPLTTGGELMCSGRVSSSFYMCCFSTEHAASSRKIIDLLQWDNVSVGSYISTGDILCL